MVNPKKKTVVEGEKTRLEILRERQIAQGEEEKKRRERATLAKLEKSRLRRELSTKEQVQEMCDALVEQGLCSRKEAEETRKRIMKQLAEERERKGEK